MKNRKGFTLIELLAVIVILAIVMVVTIPSVLNSMSSAKISQLDNASKELSDWLTKQYNISSFGDDMLKVDPVYTSFTEAYGEYEETYASAKALSSCEIKSNEMLSAAGISEPEVNIDLENSYVWKNDNKIEVKLTAKENGSFYVNGGTNISYSNSDTSSYSEFKIYGNSIQNGTPSPSNPVEIESVGDKSKNLFDGSISFGNLDNSGQPSGNNKKYIRIDNYIDVENFVYLTWTIKVNKYNQPYVLFYDDEYNLITRYNIRSVSSRILYEEGLSDTYTFGQYKVPVPSNAKYFKCFIYHPLDYDNLTDVKYMQVEKGSTATDYIPYNKYKIPITVSNGINSSTTNIYLDEPLRKIGDYVDYIDFKNSKVVRNIKEVTVNGTETYTMQSSGGYATNPYFIIDNLPTSGGQPPYPMSNYLVGGNITYTTTFYVQQAKNKLLFQPSNGITTVVDFKTWLSNNNVTVDYPLKTPTEESITLPNITSLNEKTTCSVGTEVQPSKIVVEY